MLEKKKFYKRPSSTKAWILMAASLSVIVFGGVWAIRTWYFSNLRPLSSSHINSYFTVVSGDSIHTISVNLQRAGLIRNSKAFESYVRSNEIQNLQAGTYVLSPSMSVQQIAAKMVKGEVAKNLLTILPGKRLDQIKQTFKDAGYTQVAVDAAFKPENFAGHAALAGLPPSASLEGYLYPDSFQRQADTPVAAILRESLDEMRKYLTADIIAGFAAQRLSIHQGVILASIVYQETGDPEAQPIVAQVFLKRLREGMKLESDATTGQYNTYENVGLPPTPISNFNKTALDAVAHPANTDYLYFVAGDDGAVHFTYTKEEHQDAIKKYCTKLCQ